MSLRERCKRIAAVVTATVLLLCAVPLSVGAAYENTHTNTGDQAIDLVAVAKTQVGYKEGDNNYNKYGKSFGYPNEAWCGFFLSWCARQANIPTAVIPTSGMASAFGKIGTFHERTSGYIPQRGDLMLYGERNDAYHVSIVEKYTASTKTVTVIDGNWSDKVSNHSTTMDNAEVAGFVTPQYTSKLTKMTLINMAAPTMLVKGSTFSVVGFVCSPRKITSVSVSVVNEAGTTVTSNKATPNAKEYDLSNLDAGVKFGTLALGKYSYVVTATDTSETKRWSYVFTVTGTATASIKDEIVPSAVKKGNTFSLAGRITCDEPLKNVAVGVYTLAGRYKTGGTAQPDTTVYNISNLDPYVSFGSLAVGKYVLKVSIRSQHLEKTWEYPFEVTTGETFSLQGATVPTQIDVGEAFTVAGKVVSSAKLTAVTIHILGEDGTRVVSVTANPGTMTYNLGELDSDVPFSKLTKGIYTYRITANTSAAQYQWQYPFAVGKILAGDLDGSGVVDTKDSLLLYSYVNGTDRLTAAQRIRIGTTTHDMLTALHLYNYTSGLVSKYP
ncbi:MAG: hypothetical protein IJC52_06100 [Clostridia bacterium]|nr:hypothetical protein [Clostridia bacterium]